MCPLPNPIPTNKLNVEPKRPPRQDLITLEKSATSFRPINITQLCKLSTILANTVNVKWAADYGENWATTIVHCFYTSFCRKRVGIWLVEKLSSGHWAGATKGYMESLVSVKCFEWQTLLRASIYGSNKDLSNIFSDKCYLGQIPMHQTLFRTTLYFTNNYYTKYFLGILRSRPTSDDRWRLVNNMVEAKECGKQDAESLHKSSGVNKLSNYKKGQGSGWFYSFFHERTGRKLEGTGRNWKETANCTSKKLELISYWNSNMTGTILESSKCNCSNVTCTFSNAYSASWVLLKQHFVTPVGKLQRQKMEVETVVENPEGDFKMPKKAVKRKIAEADKVTINLKECWNCFIMIFRRPSWTLLYCL